MAIIVYSTPVCPYCHMAKDFLKQHKIAFKDIDVTKDKAAQQDMVEKSGQTGVPVLDVNGQIIVGFDEIALKDALKIKK